MKLDFDRLNQWLNTHHRQVGVWIILAVLAAFCMQLFVRWSSGPRNAQKLAAQFAATWAIQPDPAATVSRAGDMVALFRSTEDGVGITIVNLKNKNERILQRARDSEYYTKARAARVWGWAPDDSVFAYTWADENGDYSLFLCDRTGEEQVAQLPLSQGLRTLKWLGPDACVYIDWATNLVWVKRTGTGWQQEKAWPLPAAVGRPALEPVDAETVLVGWLGGNELWEVKLTSGTPMKIYSTPPGNTIDTMRYEPAKRALLLAESARRATTSTLFQLSQTADGWNRREVGRWPTIRAIEWVNAGDGFAIHVRQGENNYLLLKPHPFGREIIHFKGGGVMNIFTATSTGAVYAVASVSNEPPAIWACLGSEKKRICSLEGGSSSPLRYQPVLVGWAPFNGHNAQFELVPPANFSRNKKYPLVIGLAGYTWSPVPHAVCAQTLANAGAYVALSGFTFRDDLRKVSLEHVDNINAIYNIMVQSPNVDADRVFVFAFSGSTTTICELLKRYPGRFKGVILLHPGELPEPVAGMCERVLLTAGVDEGWTRQRIVEYREALFKIGIPAEVFLHDAGGHIARAQRTMRERAQLMVKTVFK